MRDLFKKVKQWLESCSAPCFDITAYELTVMGEAKRLAVKYSQDVGTHTATSYYVLGPLPKKYRHGNERKNGSEIYGAGKAFYVACYYPEGYAKEEHKQFHPFGANYILCEIGDLAAHRISGELPHRLPAELIKLDYNGG